MIPLVALRYAGILAVVALFGLGYYWLHHRWVNEGEAIIQAKWDKAKVEQQEANQKAVADAIASNDVLRKKDADDTRKVVTNYETTIANLNAKLSSPRPGLRLIVPAVCSSAASAGKTESAGGVNAAGTTPTELPREIEDGLRDIAIDDDDAIKRKDAKIIALQDWIQSHGFAD